MSRKKFLLSLMVAFSSILFLTIGVSASASEGYVEDGTYLWSNRGYQSDRGYVSLFNDKTGVTSVKGKPKQFRLTIKDGHFKMSYSLENLSYTFEGVLKSVFHGSKTNHYVVSIMNGQRLGPTMKKKYLYVSKNGDIMMEAFNGAYDAENGTLYYASLGGYLIKNLFPMLERFL